MGRIRVLPESTINRIAAGEVVERPASVVKELVENSLDAGAASVEIRLEEGGRRRVEVADDGSGMDGDDAVAALERHATSKLQADSDLSRIGTLGFRGEALPSIAAVARLQLLTSNGESGTRVRIEGGRIEESCTAARARGTTISVRDLFFNTPARRRFLRAPSTELGHIVEGFVALSLARPDVRFRLDHGKRRLFDLPAADTTLSRLSQIEGADAAREAAEISLERDGLVITGYVLGTGRAGAPRRGRRILVNGRVVRDRLLSRAVNRGLEMALPAGTAASCIMILEIPPDQVDVNVHPAKAEVRFAYPGRVHDLVQEAITRALGGSRGRPYQPAAMEEVMRGGGAAAPGTESARFAIVDAAASYLRRQEENPSWRTTMPPEKGPEAEAPQARYMRVLGHYRSGYILADDGEGFVMVDQHAAHERILFEELTRSEGERRTPVQSLLFPRTVTVPPALRGREKEIGGDLRDLGFDSEEFGEGTLVIRGVPAPLAESDPEALILEILTDYEDPDLGRQGVESRRRRILATAACHAAVKVPSPLTEERITWILHRLLECRTPLKCPHGRPTILRWDHRSLERKFGRS